MEAVIARPQPGGGGEGVKETAKAEGELTQALGRLFALVENYPDLKATGNIAQLQEELTSTENKMAFARQLYNDVATQYNTRRCSSPPTWWPDWPRRRRPSFGRSRTRVSGRCPRSISRCASTRGVSTANLFAQQEANRRRSAWLIAGFVAVLRLGRLRR